MPPADASDTYRALSAPVLGYLRASGRGDAEDLLGEVFLQVARDLDRFPDRDDPAAVRRWVFTIARNRMIDAARRDQRRPVAAPNAEPERAAAAVELPDPELVAALGELTAEQQEVLALRFVADLPLEDVARVTGRSVGAVKSMQHRGLEQLRAALGAVSPDAGPAL